MKDTYKIHLTLQVNRFWSVDTFFILRLSCWSGLDEILMQFRCELATHACAWLSHAHIYSIQRRRPSQPSCGKIFCGIFSSNIFLQTGSSKLIFTTYFGCCRSVAPLYVVYTCRGSIGLRKHRSAETKLPPPNPSLKELSAVDGGLCQSYWLFF